MKKILSFYFARLHTKQKHTNIHVHNHICYLLQCAPQSSGTQCRMEGVSEIKWNAPEIFSKHKRKKNSRTPRIQKSFVYSPLVCARACSLAQCSLIKQDECEVKRCKQPNKRAKKWKLAKWIFIAWPYVKLGGMPHGIKHTHTHTRIIHGRCALPLALCVYHVSRNMCLYLYIVIIVFVLLQNAHRFLQSLRLSNSSRGGMKKKKRTMCTLRLNATRIINKILSDMAKNRPVK